MSSIRPLGDQVPRIGARVYVDPLAAVIGDTLLGDDVSVWPGAVLRGDVAAIVVGARSNIQDGAVVHVTHATTDFPHGRICRIGADVTIGHGAVVHACTIEDACLIGMHATVLDGAVIHRHGFVGAGALVTAGKQVGEGELWVGNPARLLRRLTAAEIAELDASAVRYMELKDRYLGNA